MNVQTATSGPIGRQRDWDAIVIGAGPAGGAAAHQLACRGLRTMLVEASEFPRQKVCGGCLNGRALAAIKTAGLTAMLDHCGTVPLRSVDIWRGGQRLAVPTPPGAAIGRAEFDAQLLQAAVAAGAAARAGAQAAVSPVDDSDWRTVRVVDRAGGGPPADFRARIVLACDGLARPSLRELEQFHTVAVSSTRIGAGARLAAPDAANLPAERITMAVGNHGYVGIVRLADGSANIAAALDRTLVKRSTLAAAVTTVLTEAGVTAVSMPAVQALPWRGTRPLTQHAPRVADRRLLLLGDAAGYVEPFTGEGMAVALESALAVAPLAVEAARRWTDDLAAAWTDRHRCCVQSRERTVTALAWTLRRPVVAGVVFGAARRFPRLTAAVAARVAQAGPPTTEQPQG